MIKRTDAAREWLFGNRPLRFGERFLFGLRKGQFAMKADLRAFSEASAQTAQHVFSAVPRVSETPLAKCGRMQRAVEDDDGQPGVLQ